MNTIERSIEPDSIGHRHILQYNGNNFYVVITDNSFNIAGTSHKIPDRTHVAFGIINRLATRLVEDGVDLEDLAGMVWSESRDKGDLADTISKSIEREMETNG